MTGIQVQQPQENSIKLVYHCGGIRDTDPFSCVVMRSDGTGQ